MEVYLHSFLIWAIDDGDRKASQPDPFTSTETAPITHWLEDGLGVLEKSFPCRDPNAGSSIAFVDEEFSKIRHNISVLINTCQHTQNCKEVFFTE